MEISLLHFVVIGIFALAIWQHFTKSGRGRALGGTITETISDRVVYKKGQKTTEITVHVVSQSKPQKLVGIEIKEKFFAGFNMKPISLSKAEALRLSKLLSEAAQKT
ncbi:hypothetical protein [Microbulbifer hydrolyticus]|uniref:Uncharacterized protein n=1 Tax=Microbulbifer hydrolyticus TaxID=48074 RepID=A0A6P1TEV5_9GAMM|nr:hypothetical protein [Microbulbifer hydrolyticus]MBB5212546.1 hypothetical protein [Microbulbifer hydrolyticus]QHQ40165.1 hypothetical protein GTQ55_15045 [Microbulbifer hydrolyticus]